MKDRARTIRKMTRAEWVERARLATAARLTKLLPQSVLTAEALADFDARIAEKYRTS
jgi:hypothetical protein